MFRVPRVNSSIILMALCHSRARHLVARRAVPHQLPRHPHETIDGWTSRDHRLETTWIRYRTTKHAGKPTFYRHLCEFCSRGCARARLSSQSSHRGELCEPDPHSQCHVSRRNHLSRVFTFRPGRSSFPRSVCATTSYFSRCKSGPPSSSSSLLGSLPVAPVESTHTCTRHSTKELSSFPTHVVIVK